MSIFTGKRIVLGISGGIAAYKAADLARQLGKAGADVHCVLTEGGAHFVTPITFQALTGNPAWTDAWDSRQSRNMAHIELTRGADLLLVAPATADVMAKLAHGMADDLLTTLALARECPLAVCPAMNRQMWENPATQRNLAQLRADGIAVFGPASGEQACGEVGMGRMLEPLEIVAEVAAFFTPKRLAGRKVLLTAGPTFEPLDPVRGITNISSGKMGFALARACADAGAEVTLVAGPVSQPTPRGVNRIDVQTALQMRNAVLANVMHADVFIGVAAVADYRPADAAEHKLKKTGSGGMTIELVQNPDILAEVAALPNPPFCIGFAAESQNLDEYAAAKRAKKRVPLLVGNLVQDGMGGDDNRVVLFDDAGRHELPQAPKDEVAQAIVAHFARMLA
ncbi:bifunctional phosphopantothenoylcysteine decarboxylase/phosphopantothenate--cysteine ligase CoaBC [Niveibacterium sp. 24ML]|uniref:bifunctional phosphopantothenoylcysteine decarboxylase/phosphopantothenate--cysteine ligase CoaBC n=1 Tax=Niveibacterium sp. 24ML TaxID=2985512 RepID=UPI00226E9223|nr:bifunctional phosphopantothenoylcysteine decarboxylase/phosphopantothenate--cysteine ligase CoaBC [Niveibacterium sp. 24ML]MCX9158396.1 bifunctional phosphopantothenoylcysteine decarboxylase/phosphopantothenate--cysteine ligase CoaBC [Niveibacterium sp. 24ML]